MNRLALISILMLAVGPSLAQFQLRGTVTDFRTAERLAGCQVRILELNKSVVSNNEGVYLFENLPANKYSLVFSLITYQTDTIEVKLKNDKTRSFKMNLLTKTLGDMNVIDQSGLSLSYASLRGVDPEGMAIYKGMKSNDLKMNQIQGNKSTNNSRELFNQVAGLNIWESDGAGIQLGIGGRGLSPDRSSNFNVRQNGYDISADALGYPESYYSPPSEAVSRIEIVRGAASLQYGTQFGGVVNFKLNHPFKNQKLGIITRNTFGSNSLFSNFTHLGGRYGTNMYDGYINYKKGHDFRPNSAFDQVNSHVSFKKLLTENMSISAEYTHMNYLAQQPGGLTDNQFYENPYASYRDRNWFQVNWNLAAINFQAKIKKKSMVNVRTFGLLADRKSLGVLTRTDREDPQEERNLISGQFKNIGTEARFLTWYGRDTLPQVFLAGFRLYRGKSSSSQGAGDDGSGPNFEYLTADSLDSDYLFPSYNVAVFAQNIFSVNERLSFVPGIRFEHIVTQAEGYYVRTLKDLAGNVIEQRQFDETQNRSRSFVIAGLGASYEVDESIELYGNFSQNYRAITFNDIRVVNPNFRIDSTITDEKGFSGDLGLRGRLLKGAVNFDLSGFYLFYRDRIGLISQVDDVLNTVYMLRTNVADSRNLGGEGFVNINWIKLVNDSSDLELNTFANVAYINTKYLSENNPNIEGNRVELAPEFTLKSGVNLKYQNWGVAWQISYTGFQYTDASNSVSTPSAINGIIPAYTVQDLSANYTFKFLKLEAGINNLMDEVYFTRRASGYPGPGILPSAGRTFYATLQLRF
jgi:Fe(3+) dicitrate transport protein